MTAKALKVLFYILILPTLSSSVAYLLQVAGYLDFLQRVPMIGDIAGLAGSSFVSALFATLWVRCVVLPLYVRSRGAAYRPGEFNAL